MLAVSKAGISPLDVMLRAMREKLDAGDIDAAADRATDCAPYVHARLSAATIKHEDPFAGMSRDDIDRALALALAAQRNHPGDVAGEIAEGAGPDTPGNAVH
jgi:hypothetical protein